MSCSIIEHEGWTVSLRLRAMRERIPLSGILELTWRCNLRCRHCYLGKPVRRHPNAYAARELNTAQWVARFQEWAAAGCLNLLITGGEPLIRPDFPEIYRHAVELGMLVTVFTNGTRITPSMVRLFRALPPRKVEISIYGATASTFDNVAHVPGACEDVWRGINGLLDAGVRVGLKTILMRLNQHELLAMAEQAAALGLPFRYDPLICPPLHGASTPHTYDPANESAGAQDSVSRSDIRDVLALRVPPEEVITLKQSMTDYRQQTATALNSRGDRPSNTQPPNPDKILPPDNALYSCAAGATLFSADPFGAYAPCLMTVNDKIVPDGRRSFKDIWENELGAIRHLKRKRKLNTLEAARFSGHANCPGLNLLETGDPELASDYVRKLNST